MTREYAARQLLAHGALTARQFIEITGWTSRIAHHTLERLIGKGVLRHTTSADCSRYLYELAE